jgi:hypothetical protein
VLLLVGLAIAPGALISMYFRGKREAAQAGQREAIARKLGILKPPEREGTP